LYIGSRNRYKNRWKTRAPKEKKEQPQRQKEVVVGGAFLVAPKGVLAVKSPRNKQVSFCKCFFLFILFLNKACTVLFLFVRDASNACLKTVEKQM
jgi:hypothetical protein